MNYNNDTAINVAIPMNFNKHPNAYFLIRTRNKGDSLHFQSLKRIIVKLIWQIMLRRKISHDLIY